MRTYLGLLLLLFSFEVNAQKRPSLSPLKACFLQAQKESSPGERDRRRLTCLNQFAKRSNFNECFSLTGRFEYSIHSEGAKQTCLFATPQKLNVKNCLKTAQSLEYGENKDELLWTCIREIPSLSNTKSCLSMAKEMVFSPYRQRATSYCLSELPSR